MFRHFATLVNDPKELFNAHPFELVWLLEEVWRNPENNDPNKPLGHPDRRSNLQAMASYNDEWPPLSGGLGRIIITTAGGDETLRRFRWDHLIYAYMIENTRVYEIFRRVPCTSSCMARSSAPRRMRASVAAQHGGAVFQGRRAVLHRLGQQPHASGPAGEPAQPIPAHVRHGAQPRWRRRQAVSLRAAPTRRTTNSSPRSRSSCAKSGSE